MKTKFALGAVVAAIAVFSQTAFAQTAAPVTREERKADTAEANKAGKLAPAGEAAGRQVERAEKAKTANSDKTRMERKDTTKAAIKAGETKPAGEAADMKTEKADKAKTASSDKTRMERKDQTKSDIKAGETKPAGEAATPLSVPAKK